MKEFKVGVIYQVGGYVTVAANNKEEALQKAYRLENPAVVEDKDWLEGSWSVDRGDVTEVLQPAKEERLPVRQMTAKELAAHILSVPNDEYVNISLESQGENDYSDWWFAVKRYIPGYASWYVVVDYAGGSYTQSCGLDIYEDESYNLDRLEEFFKDWLTNFVENIGSYAPRNERGEATAYVEINENKKESIEDRMRLYESNRP